MERMLMPQSILSTTQDISLNQHPPQLQDKVINSKLWQLKNEHVCFFHSDYTFASPSDS